MSQEREDQANQLKKFTPEEVAAMREAGMPEDLIANACAARRWRILEGPRKPRSAKLTDETREILAKLGYRPVE